MFAMRPAMRTARMGARGFAGHWESMAQQIPASKKEEFNAIIGDMRKAKIKASEVSKSVAPIDWDHFKGALPADQVEKIKAEYEATKYTDFKEEGEQAKAALRSSVDPMVSEIQATIAELESNSETAQEKIKELSASLTTFDTKLDDVLDRYPELDAKLETMIDNNLWDPDMAMEEGGGGVDEQRAGLIKANW